MPLSSVREVASYQLGKDNGCRSRGRYSEIQQFHSRRANRSTGCGDGATGDCELAEWGKDKIVFIITHRLSTIRNADQIAFLDDGRLREVGTHDELMFNTADYAKFVTAELGDAHE